MRSERSTRAVSIGTNALASSIVLALRPRPSDAPTTDRRGLIAALQGELPDALRKLQAGRNRAGGSASGGDRAGDGGVPSLREASSRATATKMTVRSALARINEILDQVLNEQEGDFDASTRFGIAWYRSTGTARASSATPTTSPGPATQAWTRWCAPGSCQVAQAR